MATPQECESKIKRLGWPGLQKLWNAIQARDTPGWDDGKAFEYLILRAFDLDKARVRWPYSVDLFGNEIEQIDGSVQVAGLYCLVESKDETENIAIAPVAKLRNQLLLRPAGTVGLVFASGEFTEAATQLAYFTAPQAILLWSGKEVGYCIQQKKISDLCEMKYRECVDGGVPDFDVRTGDIP